MLYIIDIDEFSFGLSGVSGSSEDMEAVYPKTYVAISVKGLDDEDYLDLVSIKSTIDDGKLVSAKKVTEIDLDGTVYENGGDFVTAFNIMMG